MYVTRLGNDDDNSDKSHWLDEERVIASKAQANSESECMGKT